MQLMDQKKAYNLILAGNAPAGISVKGELNFAKRDVPVTLPENLTVRRLVLDDCLWLDSLPHGLMCYELSLRNTSIRTLPDDLKIHYQLDLSGCMHLQRLPHGLTVGSLILRDCGALNTLPEALDVYFLDLTNCRSLEVLPGQGAIRGGKLIARNCTQLRSLPDWITDLAQLDVSGCERLTALPEGLMVSEWLDLAHTGISTLPSRSKGVDLRWRDVSIDERVAFQPDTLSAQEILGTANAELRRVMMERKGYEDFLREAKAEKLDQDFDPGGVRRLLRVAIPGDEDLVCLAVSCPSTGRQYLLRVPPNTRTCRGAAAWIAGFDNADDYTPIAET
jgi:hypothetical protein